MTREDQVQICRACMHKKMDMERGIVCNLTDERATFAGECSSFRINSAVSTMSESSYAEPKTSNNDMLFGALWFIGGVIGTVADIGYIFWGAILFGAIQFFKGVMNS